MVTDQKWVDLWPEIRQWWLVEGLTGKKVAAKLATRNFHVKGSQVDYQARSKGLRKRLRANTAASKNRTSQDSQSNTLEQRVEDNSTALHQTSREPNTLKQAQLGNNWAAGGSDTSASEHVQVSAFFSPSSGNTERGHHHIAGVTSYSSWTSQYDQEPLDDAGSRWMMSQDRSNSQRPPNLQRHCDSGASIDNVIEDLFECRGYQAELFDSSYNNNDSTDLSIDPLSFPAWDPINTYSESQFAYDMGGDSGQGDIEHRLF